MDSIKLVRELGKAIQQEEAYKALKASQEACDADSELQDKIGEFNLKRMSLNEEASKDTKDDEKIKTLNAQLRSVYAEVMANPNMAAYNEAQHEMNSLMQKINGILELCLAGEDPDTCEPSEGCSGSCSTCGGCH